MKVSGQASALRQSFIETGANGLGDLPYPQPVKGPSNRSHNDRANQKKRARLVPGGRDGKDQIGSFFVPDSVVVACNHAEAVTSRTKVVVKRLAPCSGLLPISIVSFQLVTEAHFLRCHETGGGIVNFKIAGQGGQTKSFNG